MTLYDRIKARRIDLGMTQAELAEKKITCTMKVGANGKTFGSVSSKEIAEIIKNNNKNSFYI